MKRWIAILMIFTLLVGLSGCQAAESSAAQKGGQSNINEPKKNNDKDANNGARTGSSAAIPASGVYWATYTVPGPADPEKLEQEFGIKAPFYVSRVEILELSTEELVEGFEFSEGVNCVTVTDNRDNAQYWMERIQREDGQTVSLKLASTAANDFYLYVTICPVSSSFPAYNANCLKSDSGVHSPEGSTLPDPYKDPENPIAGFKELRFKCGSYRQGSEIRSSVENAGYSTYDSRFENGIFSFDIRKELDGRAKVEEIVLKPEHWKPVEAETKGNVGMYRHSDSYTGKISFNWTYLSVPFTVKMNDAKLTLSVEGDDVDSYTLTGTAEINPKSFTLGGIVYRLEDNNKKSYTGEDAFLIQKTPELAANWNLMESWQYMNDYGIPFMLPIDFKTSKSVKDIDFVKFDDTEHVDGTYKMDFMMPAFGGTATWHFEPKYDK